MKPNQLFKQLSCFAFVLAMGLGNSSGDEGEGEGEEEKVETNSVACGKLAGHTVIFSTSTSHETFNRGNERFDTRFYIARQVLNKNGKQVDTTLEDLLGWESSVFGNGVEAATGPDVKAKKNSLRLLYGDNVIGDFTYQKDRLLMTPEFRKKIIQDLEKDSTNLAPGDLLEILSGSSWPDKHILQVLELYAIRHSIREGYFDSSIDSLQTMKEQAVDDTIARYCKRLADSLVAQKKADQPLKLEGAKKVGAILNDPIYPPLDSPSVFWQDTLLVVVQEEATKPRMMRTYDPRTGKWGKKAPVKFPQTDITEMFVKETGTYSIACPYVTVCWRKKLGEFDDDPCEGLECGPLILLPDSIDGGSLRHFTDLKKAGGSCAAGWGAYEFRNGGTLYPLGETKVSWDIITGVISGTRKYEFELTRDYPVVVSPDQNWIAYALGSKDGKRKELWVARLKYKQ